jgi:outer membrane protein assembly factor BamB
VLWRADGQGFGAPTFDASTVYFVGRDHELVAVDKSTGDVRWRARSLMFGEVTQGYSAVVTGGVVVLGDYNLHAFDRETGKLAWVFSPEAGYGPGAFHLGTDGNVVFAGSPSGRLYAVDAATGRQRWSAVVWDDTKAAVFDPSVSQGVVYVCVRRNTTPTTGGVAAVDATTGTVLWRSAFPAKGPGHEAGCSPRAVVAGDVVVGATWDGTIHALDRRGGRLRWSAAPATTGSPDYRPLVGAGSTVIAGSTTGNLIAFDAATGRQLWQSTARMGSVVYPLAVDRGQVYANHAGQLAAFDLATGRVTWVIGDRPRDARFTYAPASDGVRVYAGAHDGLFAIRAR